MRLTLLPLLFSAVAAQVQQRHQSQVQLPFSASDSPALPSHTPGSTERLFGFGKRIFDAAILGKTPVEDTKLRDERDATDGVERLMNENWDILAKGPEDDLWVILISGPPRDFIDFRFLDTHINATRLTREHRAEKGGMEGIHFARVDYMQEVEICTKWLVFRSPIIAFVSDQGRTVRWAPKGIAGAGGEFLYEILESRQWENLPIWHSRYAPGGDRAYIVDFYLNSSNNISTQMSKVPSLVWMGLFAALTQSVVKWLHSPSPTRRVTTQRPGAVAAKVDLRKAK